MSSNPLAALVMMLLFLTQTPADALPYDPYPCCVAWRDEAPVLSARYGLGFDTSALKHKIFTTSAGPSLVYKPFAMIPMRWFRAAEQSLLDSRRYMEALDMR